MTTHNEITGDALVSRRSNDNYRDNYDRIFGKKKEKDNGAGASAVQEHVSGGAAEGAGGSSGSDNTERTST